MNAKDVIKYTLDSNQQVLKMYLEDLSDADLLARPVPNANHIAWQLGHLINSEVQLLGMVPGYKPAELPAGFGDKYKKETAKSDSPSSFLKKAEYLDLLDKVRAGTLAALAKMPEADLDKATTGEMAGFAPTYAAVFVLIANHTMMHAGQFTAARRKLGKPVLF